MATGFQKELFKKRGSQNYQSFKVWVWKKTQSHFCHILLLNCQGAHLDSRGYIDFISRWKEYQVICGYLNVAQWIRKPVVLMGTSRYFAVKRGTNFKMNLSQWTLELKNGKDLSLKAMSQPHNQPILEMLLCLDFCSCEIINVLIFKANLKKI